MTNTANIPVVVVGDVEKTTRGHSLESKHRSGRAGILSWTQSSHISHSEMDCVFNFNPVTVFANIWQKCVSKSPRTITVRPWKLQLWRIRRSLNPLELTVPSFFVLLCSLWFYCEYLQLRHKQPSLDILFLNPFLACTTQNGSFWSVLKNYSQGTTWQLSNKDRHEDTGWPNRNSTFYHLYCGMSTKKA